MAFFGGMPFPVQFAVAFIIVLGVIGAVAWLVRHFAASRIGGGALRGRQPRLAVIDYASVDGRRRLILVRRDNVEHLVMIGGPTDIVVEANIVRSAAVAAARPPAAVDPLRRAIPMQDDAGANGWANGSANAARPPVASRPPRETVAALPDEPAAPRNGAQASPRPQPAVPRLRPEETRQENRQEVRPDSRQEPRLPPAQHPADGSTDQALAEMAHQLEAALRKPVAKADKSDASEPRPSPMPKPVTPADAAAAPPQPATPFSAPRAVRANVAENKGGDVKPQASGKPHYDDLEQEMASLLGRSSAKN